MYKRQTPGKLFRFDETPELRKMDELTPPEEAVAGATVGPVTDRRKELSC